MAAITHVQQGIKVIQGLQGPLVVNPLTGEEIAFENKVYKTLLFNEEGWAGLVKTSDNTVTWVRDIMQIQAFEHGDGR
eukprot:8959620-Lingulodinium_polyedra.AAC.1